MCLSVALTLSFLRHCLSLHPELIDWVRPTDLSAPGILYLNLPNTGSQACALHLALCEYWRNLNSDPHTCMASNLPTLPSPHILLTDFVILYIQRPNFSLSTNSRSVFLGSLRFLVYSLPVALSVHHLPQTCCLAVLTTQSCFLTRERKRWVQRGHAGLLQTCSTALCLFVL